MDILLLLLLLLNVKINVALSENASRTWYTIKVELKLRKWVLEKKSFQLSFERHTDWQGCSVDYFVSSLSLNNKSPKLTNVTSYGTDVRNWCVYMLCVLSLKFSRFTARRFVGCCYFKICILLYIDVNVIEKYVVIWSGRPAVTIAHMAFIIIIVIIYLHHASRIYYHRRLQPTSWQSQWPPDLDSRLAYPRPRPRLSSFKTTGAEVTGRQKTF